MDLLSRITEGVVEIWLTSEDLGAYGHDIGVTLPQLLWKLVEVIPEGARMRLGMTNPPYILEHLPVSMPMMLLDFYDWSWAQKLSKSLLFLLIMGYGDRNGIFSCSVQGSVV